MFYFVVIAISLFVLGILWLSKKPTPQEVKQQEDNKQKWWDSLTLEQKKAYNLSVHREIWRRKNWFALQEHNTKCSNCTGVGWNLTTSGERGFFCGRCNGYGHFILGNKDLGKGAKDFFCDE